MHATSESFSPIAQSPPPGVSPQNHGSTAHRVTSDQRMLTIVRGATDPAHVRTQAVPPRRQAVALQGHCRPATFVQPGSGDPELAARPLLRIRAFPDFQPPECQDP